MSQYVKAKVSGAFSFAEVSEMLELINGSEPGDLMTMSAEDMSFLGFDPLEFMKILMKRAETANVSKVDFSSDLFQMALLGTFRGASLKRMKDRGSAKLRDFITVCISRYGLVSNSNGSNIAITLPRVAICLASKVGLSVCSQKVMMSSSVNMSSHVPGVIVPTALTLTTFGSLIPQKSLAPNDLKLLLDAFAMNQYAYNVMISPTKSAEKEKVLFYLGVQHKSSLYLEEKRVEYCKKVGIIAQGDKGVLRLVDDGNLTLLATAFSKLSD